MTAAGAAREADRRGVEAVTRLHSSCWTMVRSPAGTRTAAFAFRSRREAVTAHAGICCSSASAAASGSCTSWRSAGDRGAAAARDLARRRRLVRHARQALTTQHPDGRRVRCSGCRSMSSSRGGHSIVSDRTDAGGAARRGTVGPRPSLERASKRVDPRRRLHAALDAGARRRRPLEAEARCSMPNTASSSSTRRVLAMAEDSSTPCWSGCNTSASSARTSTSSSP
jgi:hypothetical protein